MTISWTNPHANNYVQLSRAISEMTPPGKIPAVDAQERGGGEREKGRLRPPPEEKVCRDTMTNERARARALCMNEYDRNIVSLLSKLFIMD